MTDQVAEADNRESACRRAFEPIEAAIQPELTSWLAHIRTSGLVKRLAPDPAAAAALLGDLVGAAHAPPPWPSPRGYRLRGESVANLGGHEAALLEGPRDQGLELVAGLAGGRGEEIRPGSLHVQGELADQVGMHEMQVVFGACGRRPVRRSACGTP